MVAAAQADHAHRLKMYSVDKNNSVLLTQIACECME